MDAALVGEAPPPLELRKFLLVAGTPPQGLYGMGYSAIFARPLTAHEFEIYSAIQQRVALSSSKEGLDDIRRERAIRHAIRLEQAEAAQQSVHAAYPVTIQPPPFDPARMTPAQIAEWVERYAGGPS